MKKFLFFLTALVAMVIATGCSSNDTPATPILEVENSSITFEATAGSQQLKVTTNQESISATSNATDWCNVTVANSVLTISIEENTTLVQRTATVTVKAGTLTKSITVTQAAANVTLEVEGTKYDAPAEGGTSGIFTVTSNTQWEATVPAEDTWCKVNSATDGFTITVEPYKEDKTRTTVVRITAGGRFKEVTVTQQGEKKTVYSIAVPTDFSASFVQKVMLENTQIAEIAREYLYAEEANGALTTALVNGQFTVIYPVKDGVTDLTKGIVVENGSSVSWDKTTNKLTYVKASSNAPFTTVYWEDGELSTTTDETTTSATTVTPYLLNDNRKGSTAIAYAIVKVGTQYWMAENLKATTYLDGSQITFIASNGTSFSSESGVYGYPEGQADYYKTFGAHYNGHAVQDQRGLAPEGWEVPSEEQWNLMKSYVTKSFATRSSSTRYWTDIKTYSYSNATNFSILPAGYTISGVENSLVGTRACIWLNTENYDALTKTYQLKYAVINRATSGALGANVLAFGKTAGLSVRCIRK